MRALLSGLIALTIVGCVTPASEEITLSATFDAAKARAQLVDGTNTVKANAFVRQQGGGVVTCAGSEAVLIPATEYAVQRIQAVYGNTTQGLARTRVARFVPDSTEYRVLQKKTKCDGQGKFVFEKIADGEYFVITRVEWVVMNKPQGGPLMQRVVLKGGQTLEIVMVP